MKQYSKGIFLQNKYTDWYFKIINQATSEHEYCEKHHILPKSIFPEFKDDPNNIIKLSAREHYICHLLLTKMTTSNNKRSMSYAFWGMTNQNNKDQKRYTGKLYEYSKRMMQESLSNDRKNKTLEEIYGEEKASKIRKAMKGRKTRNPPDELERKEISERIKSAAKSNKEWKYNFRANGQLPKKTCEHCDKTMDPGNFARYHGDKCKLR